MEGGGGRDLVDENAGWVVVSDQIVVIMWFMLYELVCLHLLGVMRR